MQICRCFIDECIILKLCKIPKSSSSNCLADAIGFDFSRSLSKGKSIITRVINLWENLTFDLRVNISFYLADLKMKRLSAFKINYLNCLTNCLQILFLIKSEITNFFAMLPFCTPWKQRTVRFSDVFRGVEKGCIVSKWVN